MVEQTVTSRRKTNLPISTDIRSERLAYWYLRLNGFLTITNFVVHPDRGSNQETDVDLVCARFPFRAENLMRPMLDDDRLSVAGDKIQVRFAEVKASQCALNGPWVKPHRRNMLRVLMAIGLFPECESELVANALHQRGRYTNQIYDVRLICFGAAADEELRRAYPEIDQVLWAHALAFIYRRFRDYKNEKISHGQWDPDGQDLWDAAFRSRTEEDFRSGVRVI